MLSNVIMIFFKPIQFIHTQYPNRTRNEFNNSSSPPALNSTFGTYWLYAQKKLRNITSAKLVKNIMTTDKTMQKQTNKETILKNAKKPSISQQNLIKTYDIHCKR